jgi:hypothetical protein
MEKIYCFVAVEFPDDPNVAGYYYWYICDFDGAEIGDKVIAPLGRHNNTQEGVIVNVRFCDEFDAPYSLSSIKSIRKLIKK